jgi:hypothetical protein
MCRPAGFVFHYPVRFTCDLFLNHNFRSYLYWEREKDHFKAFDEVADFRNRLAHCTLDVSNDALTRPVADGVAFVDRDDCTPITDRDFNDFEVKANMIYSCLHDIERLLPYKEVPLPKP